MSSPKSKTGLPKDRKAALEFRKPVDRLADRKARFAELNDYVSQRHGWLTSVPGALDCELQVLPGSTLPADVAERFGVKPEEIGETQRILAHGISERFARGLGGGLELITAESTRVVAETRTHAGIVRVLRCTFRIPG